MNLTICNKYLSYFGRIKEGQIKEGRITKLEYGYEFLNYYSHKGKKLVSFFFTFLLQIDK